MATKLPDNFFRGEDLSGKKINAITVIAFSRRVRASGKAPKIMWLCKCDCGREIEINGAMLHTGLKNCGCGINRKFRTKHGLSKHPIYRSWLEMRRRCLSKNDIAYPNWGGKGITICERWSNFALFYEDMIPTWKAGLSLGRINNHRGYSPANCRWETDKEQNNNTSNNRIIKIGSEEKTMTQWLEFYGITANCFYNRMKRGMPEDQAMSWPSGVPWSRSIQ